MRKFSKKETFLVLLLVVLCVIIISLVSFNYTPIFKKYYRWQLGNAHSSSPQDIVSINHYIKKFSEFYSEEEIQKIILDHAAKKQKDKGYCSQPSDLAGIAVLALSAKDSEKAHRILEDMLNNEATKMTAITGLIYCKSYDKNKLFKKFKNDRVYLRILVINLLDSVNPKSFIINAIEESPDNIYYLDVYGYLLYRQKNYEKAVKQYKKAIKINPEEAFLYEHLADVYLALGEKEKAQKEWKKALTITTNKKNIRTIKQKLKRVKITQ